MSDYDNDLIEQMVRDGIRTRGGQHVGRQAHPSVTMRWGCERCRDQGCDFCNEPGRGTDGEGDRDQKLDR